MSHVVVAGAGPGGLAAALFAARRGHDVTVLEPDAPPRANVDPDGDVWEWDRSGVAHATQGHAFLALSTRVLAAEAPDVTAAIVARGAPAVSFGPGPDEVNLLCRRLVHEAVLRRHVEAEPGVSVVSGVRVDGLVVGGEIDGVPRVVGLRTSGGEVVPGDLVVDATGRNSRVGRWLAAAGARPPVETAQRCGFSYLTRHYRLREGATFPESRVPVVAELAYATVIVFPGDNGRFQLSTTVGARDPLRHRLLDGRLFDRFLGSVPATAAWLDRGIPMCDPLPMAKLENRWRRFVDDTGPVVCGLAVLGDAAVQTNPTFGRGVSLALRHAQGLAELLDDPGADPVGWARRFDEWTAAHLGQWFAVQLATDAARMREMSGAAGAPDMVERLLTAMALLQADDEHVRRASDRVYNLLMTPQELMGDRTLARRLLAFLRTHPDAVRRPVGPGRAEFEQLVAG